ncbi:MAG: polyprenyl synthetase family protein [Xanthomonadaceae bacterium]|nr:polyprenyl synthetase family protein [Xanthomonadaceae bacterium]
MSPSESPARWHRWAQRCENFLTDALRARGNVDARLAQAMAYAALGGGKRMRPLLVYATGTALGADESVLDAPAAAIELIHAYSLVHDDLPAMDDDRLRRGRPTVHVAFDEASAILAGDGLLTLAFELLADAPTAPTTALAMVRTLAKAAGMQGMVAGQAIDLASVGTALDADALRRMHGAKTGALIRAAVALGALAADANAASRAALDDFADALGLAFQIRDDILDVEGDPALTGKTAGKDAASDKPTYPAILGLDASRALLAQLAQRMDGALATLACDTAELAALARFAAARGH